MGRGKNKPKAQPINMPDNENMVTAEFAYFHINLFKNEAERLKIKLDQANNEIDRLTKLIHKQRLSQ